MKNKKYIQSLVIAVIGLIILTSFNISQRKPEISIEREFSEFLHAAENNQKEIELTLDFRPTKESFSLTKEIPLEKRLRIASLAFESGLLKLKNDSSQAYALNILFGERVFTSYFSKEDIEATLQRKVFFKLLETFLNKKLP